MDQKFLKNPSNNLEAFAGSRKSLRLALGILRCCYQVPQYATVILQRDWSVAFMDSLRTEHFNLSWSLQLNIECCFIDKWQKKREGSLWKSHMCHSLCCIVYAHAPLAALLVRMNIRPNAWASLWDADREWKNFTGCRRNWSTYVNITFVAININ